MAVVIDLWRMMRDLDDKGVAAESDLNEETWLTESRDLAKSTACGPEVIGQLRQLERSGIDVDSHPVDLSEDYMSEAGHVAEQRIIEAGYRLGAILKAIANQ